MANAVLRLSYTLVYSHISATFSSAPKFEISWKSRDLSDLRQNISMAISRTINRFEVSSVPSSLVDCAAKMHCSTSGMQSSLKHPDRPRVHDNATRLMCCKFRPFRDYTWIRGNECLIHSGLRYSSTKGLFLTYDPGHV